MIDQLVLVSRERMPLIIHYNGRHDEGMPAPGLVHCREPLFLYIDASGILTNYALRLSARVANPCMKLSICKALSSQRKHED
jgi:hypothetical protein